MRGNSSPFLFCAFWVLNYLTVFSIKIDLSTKSLQDLNYVLHFSALSRRSFAGERFPQVERMEDEGLAFLNLTKFYTFAYLKIIILVMQMFGF